MALITKPDFTYVWASGGAIVAPNDAKKQQGWVAEAPPFQYDNWLQNRQDQMLAHINQRGIPAWDGLTNYEAGGLSYVQGSDGKVYKSVAASGPSSVVSNPTTDGTDTYWTVAFADVGAFLTQAAGDTRYTQRSNNLSDVTNAASARTNLGLADTVTAGISGSHSNLKASTTGTNATVTLSADSVCLKSASSSQVVINSLSLSINSASSGVNGLDTGTIAASTWYYVWVIWNGTTVAGLLSLSATAPTMPATYTHKARVGSLRTDASGNKYPLSFDQKGSVVQWKVATGSNVAELPVIATGTLGAIAVPTWITTTLTAAVPPTATRITIMQMLGLGLGTMMAAPSNSYGAHNSASNPPPAVLGQTGGGTQNSMTSTFNLEQASIVVAHQAATNITKVLAYEEGF